MWRCRLEKVSIASSECIAHFSFCKSDLCFSLSQVSSAISECACGCGNDSSPNKETWNDDSKRQSPPPGHLEFSSYSVDEFASPKKGNENFTSLEPELEIVRP